MRKKNFNLILILPFIFLFSCKSTSNPLDKLDKGYLMLKEQIIKNEIYDNKNVNKIVFKHCSYAILYQTKTEGTEIIITDKLEENIYLGMIYTIYMNNGEINDYFKPMQFNTKYEYLWSNLIPIHSHSFVLEAIGNNPQLGIKGIIAEKLL